MSTVQTSPIANSDNKRSTASMDGILEWFAALGTIIAATLVALDRGRRTTGWGFVLFVVVSVSWIISGIANDAVSIVIQNAALLLVNMWGVWRYLLNPERSRIEGNSP
ncbi:MAG: hypothetical protein ACK47M_17110 [Caldilinea sp.]